MLERDEVEKMFCVFFFCLRDSVVAFKMDTMQEKNCHVFFFIIKSDFCNIASQTLTLFLFVTSVVMLFKDPPLVHRVDAAVRSRSLLGTGTYASRDSRRHTCTCTCTHMIILKDSSEKRKRESFEKDDALD